jgi:hypothetical protein
VKTFKHYLAEAEKLRTENSNLPVANDSTSPISGRTQDPKFAERLQRRKIKPDETVQSNRR